MLINLYKKIINITNTTNKTQKKLCKLEFCQ